MPRFDVERFRRLLRTRVLGQSCHAFDVLASTNTFLYALGRQGVPEGTIVLADEQTADGFCLAHIGLRWVPCRT